MKTLSLQNLPPTQCGYQWAATGEKKRATLGEEKK